MALDLKTFVISGSPARLAALLTAVGYPFYFAGTDIEITCENGILNNSSGMTRNSLKKFQLPWRNNFVILRIYMRRIIHVYNCIIMEMKKTIEKIPTWAFGYIFNGDMTGLTDEEVKQIDEALEQIGVDIVCTPADEEAQPYFTHYPLFGLPAEVEDCVILYR